ncbi:MAG: bifunctional hydroxymethylpyrimidine kinase/phosphomethylpyrimidine kinase, partial [Bacteroidota bacterium]
ELVLYTGYLSTPEQVDDILELIDDYRHQIHAVVVDPVCGDGGKPYVSENLIHSFDRLLKIADVATPNRTELALVQGLSVENDVLSLIDAFVKRYPSIALITTGVLWEREIGNYLTVGNHTEVLRHSMEVDRLLSGTGDLFAALFIYYRYLQGMKAHDAVKRAGDRIVDLIANDRDRSHRPEELQFDLNSAVS